MQQQRVKKKRKSPNQVAKEKFYRKKISLFKKAYQLGKMCKANVYLVIYRKHQYYTFSNKEDGWPLFKSDIVSHPQFYIIIAITSFRMKTILHLIAKRPQISFILRCHN